MGMARKYLAQNLFDEGNVEKHFVRKNFAVYLQSFLTNSPLDKKNGLKLLSCTMKITLTYDEQISQFRRKFQQLYLSKIPTGDPSMPEVVRMAKHIQYLIQARADCTTGLHAEELGFEEDLPDSQRIPAQQEDSQRLSDEEAERGADIANNDNSEIMAPNPVDLSRPLVRGRKRTLSGLEIESQLLSYMQANMAERNSIRETRLQQMLQDQVATRLTSSVNDLAASTATSIKELTNATTAAIKDLTTSFKETTQQLIRQLDRIEQQQQQQHQHQQLMQILSSVSHTAPLSSFYSSPPSNQALSHQQAVMRTPVGVSRQGINRTEASNEEKVVDFSDEHNKA